MIKKMLKNVNTTIPEPSDYPFIMVREDQGDTGPRLIWENWVTYDDRDHEFLENCMFAWIKPSL